MPAEQRVITIGFVALALVILGILVAFFSGDDVAPSLDELQRLFSEYEQAEENGDLTQMRARAEEILALLDSAGRAKIETNLDALATDGDRDTLRLQKMLREHEFEKNADGQFQFNNEFYPSSVVSSLRGLQAVVKEDFGTLRKARTLAQDLNKALEDARKGSGQPIPLPAPVAAELKLPGMDSNPLLDADAALFAVYSLDPALLIGALKTKNPGGAASQARARWNRNVPSSNLAERLKALPAQLQSIQDIAARFEANVKAVEAHPNGPKAAAAIYKDACASIAAGLRSVNPKAREAFDSNRAAVEKGDVIAALLRAEEKLLTRNSARMGQLAAAFQLKFP